jgi:hypothetical protein
LVVVVAVVLVAVATIVAAVAVLAEAMELIQVQLGLLYTAEVLAELLEALGLTHLQEMLLLEKVLLLLAVALVVVAYFLELAEAASLVIQRRPLQEVALVVDRGVMVQHQAQQAVLLERQVALQPLARVAAAGVRLAELIHAQVAQAVKLLRSMDLRSLETALEQLTERFHKDKTWHSNTHTFTQPAESTYMRIPRRLC